MRKNPVFVSTMVILSALMAFTVVTDDAGGLLIDESALTEHDIIVIEGDSDFTSVNGVASGTGTSSDPYIIENWTIQAIDGHGIHVKDTSSHFIIRNCWIKDGYEDSVHRYNSGVFLENVENGTVKNCKVEGNGNGIDISGSSYLVINNNTCLRNSNGIHLKEDGSNILIGNNTCNYNGYGITLRGSYQYGQISNNTCLRNRHTGLSIQNNCKDLIVENNVCNYNFNTDIPNHETGRGIAVEGGLRITLRFNNCSGNSGYGILMSGSYGKIINNTAYDNVGMGRNTTGYGIFVKYSVGLVLKDNRINNCMVEIRGKELKHWLTISMDSSNQINGKNFLFLKNRTTPTVWSGEYGYICIVNSDKQDITDMDLSRSTIKLIYCGNATIKDNSIDRAREALQLYACDNMTIYNNRLSGSNYGIEADFCSHMYFHNNSVFRNRWIGMGIWDSPYSTIENNDLMSNGAGIAFGTWKNSRRATEIEGHSIIRGNTVYDGETGISCTSIGIFVLDNVVISHWNEGIGLNHGGYHTISGNTVLDCVKGISLEIESNNNMVSRNRVIGNQVGIDLWVECSGNMVTENVIIDSQEYGLSVLYEPEAGSYNRIFNNTFIDNNGGGVQAIDGSVNSTWDDGHGFGNYWSDYSSRYVPPAVKNGTVWSVNYTVDGTAGSEDRFPLVNYSVVLEDILLIVGDLEDEAPVDHLYESEYSMAYTGSETENITWSFSTNASWLSFTQDQVLRGKPSLSDRGEYWVNISVTDGALSDSVNFTISVIVKNFPPAITTSDVTTIDQWQQYRVDYDATDDDTELEWRLVTEADFLSINGKTGVLSGIPGLNDVGIFFVNVSVNDGDLWDITHFYLTVNDVNDPPMQNSSFTYFLLMEDTVGTYSIDDIFFNYDNDPLSISVSGVTGINVSLDNQGALTINPDQDWHGSGRLNFSVSDGHYNMVFPINVIVQSINDAPRDLNISIPGLTLSVDGDQVVTAGFYDPDIGDEVNITWYIDGIVASYNISFNLSLTEGTYNLTLRVTDSTGNYTEITIPISVESGEIDPPNPPGPDYTWLIILIISFLTLTLVGALIFILRRRSAPEEESDDMAITIPSPISRRRPGAPDIDLESSPMIEPPDVNGGALGEEPSMDLELGDIPWSDRFDPDLEDIMMEALGDEELYFTPEDIAVVMTTLKSKQEDGELADEDFHRLKEALDRIREE